jgi:hypothetical protein
VPKVPGLPEVTEAVLRQWEAQGPLETTNGDRSRAAVEEIAASYRLFHWHLEFPQIFIPDGGTSGPGWKGGFTCVIGNPPWEKVKLSEKEFFASKDPDIASLSGAKRKERIARLKTEDPTLWAEFRSALRTAEAESAFLRKSDRYPLCGRGDVNTYAVFAEAMLDVLASTGRLGVIVPTGIATDDTTKAFFANCVDHRQLVSLFDFRNRGFFPDVAGAQGNRFCLLTIGGRDYPAVESEFFFFGQSLIELTDRERRFALSSEDLGLLNPNTRTAPVFRTRHDAELTKEIYGRVPVLLREGDPGGNPWGLKYQTMFHMTGDSELFRSTAELARLGANLDGNVWREGSDVWLPLYEAKMAHHYNHRWGDYGLATLSGKEVRQIPTPSDAALARPEYQVQPRYWVHKEAVDDRLPARPSWLLGFRAIGSSLDERTFIPFALPVVATGHSLFLMHMDRSPKERLAALGILSSFAFDSVARNKLGGTNLSFFIVNQLPFPNPEFLARPTLWDTGTTATSWLLPRVLELTYTTFDMAGLAIDVGYDGRPFNWNPERRRQIRAEIDASCLHLYGLGRNEADYIMETFHVLRRKEEATYGEYLSKRLVLERYDAIAAAVESGQPYQSPLTPPPGDRLLDW